jgi:hypothetical protein
MNFRFRAFSIQVLDGQLAKPRLPRVKTRHHSALVEANRPIPREGDVALLEWPVEENNYALRLSFLDRQTEIFRNAEALFNQAQDDGTTIGEGACWLPDQLHHNGKICLNGTA